MQLLDKMLELYILIGEKADEKKRNREQAAEICMVSLGWQSKASLRDADKNGIKNSKGEHGDSWLNLSSLLKLAFAQIQEMSQKEDIAERRIVLIEQK